jgi:hypothetical protein
LTDCLGVDTIRPWGVIHTIYERLSKKTEPVEKTLPTQIEERLLKLEKIIIEIVEHKSLKQISTGPSRSGL